MKGSLLLYFMVILLYSPVLASAAKYEKYEKKECLACHTGFEDVQFKNSVHAQFSCTVCHGDIDIDKHIKGKLTPKDERRKNAYTLCIGCHDEKSIAAKANHGYLLKIKISCLECHDPHRSRSMKEEKIRKDENLYCLSCHSKKNLTMKFKDGEGVSLFVDGSIFVGSSHGKNRCSFCHEGFSKETHPKHLYESKKQFSYELSKKACARCHAEECKRFERCVHGALSKRGVASAPICSDCHDPHRVSLRKDDEKLHLLTCKKCHGQIFEAYAKGIHYSAKIKEGKNAPLCTDCHRPHEVLVTSFNLKNNEVCFRCHKEVEKVHSSWFHNPPLPSQSFVRFHLESITCNVCHAPSAGGAVYLHPHDRIERTPISLEEMSGILGIKGEELEKKLDLNRDGTVSAYELWNAFNLLLEKGRTLTLLGWMDVRDPISSHNTRPKSEALKGCELCHRHDSPFFKDAFVIFRDELGWPKTLKAHKDLLSTKTALSPLSEFYVFGSTRLGLADGLLIIALLGAVIVPVGHIVMRVMTRQLRKGRKRSI